MSAAFDRLGLIAGGGELPRRVAEACAAEGRLGWVVAVDGFAEPAAFEAAAPERVSRRSVASIGGVIRDLQAAGCDAVCFAGVVTRPDFRTLKPDWAGARLLPKAVAAAVKGDDALLRVIVAAFEEAGFTVVGAQAVAERLLAAAGHVGGPTPDPEVRADGVKALAVAGATGALDIGQGAVVCDGLVLAVEAQEGTDAMLARVAGLPAPLRGTGEARRGVLAKRPKPGQETRIDLPVIGVATVEGAARAGLAGIVAPEAGALILGRDAVAAAADAAGVSVWIARADETPPPAQAP